MCALLSVAASISQRPLSASCGIIDGNMSNAPRHLELVSARVTNYGCFADSGDVPIDSVTALIAENENGKTTFLRALAWWSDRAVAFDEADRWADAPDGLIELVAVKLRVPASTSQLLRRTGYRSIPDLVTIVRSSDGSYLGFDPTDQARNPATTRTVSILRQSANRLAEALRATSYDPAVEAADRLKAAGAKSSQVAEICDHLDANVLPSMSADVASTVSTQLTRTRTAR